MADSPAPPSPDLVHLITWLALTHPLREPILNIIQSYLCAVAKRDKKSVADIVIEQEEKVLGPAYRELVQCLFYQQSHRATDEAAEEATIDWFFEHLATIAGVLPKQA